MNANNSNQRDHSDDPYAAAGEPGQAPWQRASAKPASPPANAPPQPVLTATRQEIAGSELVLYAGETEEPLKVAQHIARFSPLHLILNRTSLSQPLSAEIPAPSYLWNWYPEDTLRQISPILLSPGGEIDLEAIVRATWPQLALVCVFSPLEHGPLLHHLRTVIRGDDGASAAPPTDEFVIYLPKAVTGLLPHAASELLAPRITQLMSMIDALLVPTDPPDRWRLFCTSRLDEALTPTIERIRTDAEANAQNGI